MESQSTVSIGRVGSFRANELIGQPYGLTYEIQGKELVLQPPRTLQEVGKERDVSTFSVYD